MKSLEKNKGVVVSIVIFAIAMFAYNTFFKPEVADPLLVEGVETENVGGDVILLYQSLESVTLDQRLFTNPSYQALVDFSTTVQDQPRGRNNPFEIIGRD